MGRKWLIGMAVLFVVAAVFAWVAAGAGVSVVIENVGDTPLHEVRVLVKGAEYELGSIAPGDSASVKVEPTGELDVRARWKTADGKSGFAQVDTYFEASGYNGEVRIELRGLAIVSAVADVEVGFF